MKEFDLYKLERKNIYKTPGNFFEEVQENVVKQTINKEKKETKVFKFSVITSIAATIVLVFGFTFLWKTDQADITNPAETDNLPKINIQKTEINVLDKQDAVSKTRDAATEIKANNNTVSILVAKTPKINKIEPKTNDLNYDQLLNSLSDDELKELTKNTDQDIYLELYN